jgi:heme-degrading monooxygenase HmoA
MSVVKINVLTVPPDRAAVLEERFAARAGEVDTVPGFESFQLLRPTDEGDRYFVVTQWESEAAFEAWMESRAFARGHGASGHGPEGHGRQGPAATGAELMSFEVVQESRGQQ